MKKIILKNFKSLIVSGLLAVTLSAPLMAANITDTMKGKLSAFSVLPGGDEGTAQKIAGNLIGAFLSLFGIIFLILMIYGGYRWMMASGREEEVQKAKDTIKAAIIGLIIVLSAYTITYFISRSLEGAIQ